jgi:lysophospholipase L1-like esterase
MTATHCILAFGDSLTWGADIATGGRHRYQDRWPTALEMALSGSARVLAEGLGGRTTVFDDFAAAVDRNGARALPMLLASHQPLDLVIVMLGSNDLKPHICGTAVGAAGGMDRLAEIITSFPYAQGVRAPRIILVSPPIFRRTNAVDGMPAAGRSIAESERLAALYESVARARGCGFFDAASVAATSPIDGVHLDAENTRSIGVAVARAVTGFL